MINSLNYFIKSQYIFYIHSEPIPLKIISNFTFRKINKDKFYNSEVKSENI